MIVKCPKCGNLVSDKAHTCSKCGASLSILDNNSSLENKQTVGHRNERPALVSQADSKQSIRDELSDSSGSIKSRKGIIVLCVCLSMVLLGLGVFILFRPLNNGHKSTIEVDGHYSSVDIASAVQDPSDNEIIEAAKNAFSSIPDHDKVGAEAMNHMTPELYEVLCAAWDVPQWVDGEIGNEEFLYYFLTGNGGSFVKGIKSAKVVSGEKDINKVEVDYIEDWGDSTTESTILLTLVKKGEKWLLDDFGDDIKNTCRSYIMEEVMDYISGKTLTYMKDNQTEDFYTDDHISDVVKAFNTYISKYEKLLVNKMRLDISNLPDNNVEPTMQDAMIHYEKIDNPDDDMNKSERISSITVKQNDFDSDTSKEETNNTSKGNLDEESIPFQLVEEKPTFNGGDANEFSEWVNQHLEYPETAKENGIQGRVTLQFTVNADGSVSNVKVIRGVDSSLDKEAVRVVSNSPKWKPGRQREKAVNVTYTFPVIFQLR